MAKPGCGHRKRLISGDLGCEFLIDIVQAVQHPDFVESFADEMLDLLVFP
jgi:hypothetical protein